MATVSTEVPRGLRARMKPRIDRYHASLRDFEWTWTKAVIVAFVLWALGMIFIAFIPSWWLYFADQKLGWHKCPCTGSHQYGPISIPNFWLFIARDVVAVILFSIPFTLFIVVPYFMQKTRRRLRSESESRPTGGYR
jgi:hypothetical protein